MKKIEIFTHSGELFSGNTGEILTVNIEPSEGETLSAVFMAPDGSSSELIEVADGRVSIPDEMLASPGRLIAFAVIQTADFRKTIGATSFLIYPAPIIAGGD